MVNVNERINSNTLTGWREWVNIPDLGVSWIKAKIDTGAQSSALHAYELQNFTRDGAEWVTFSVHPWQNNDLDTLQVELPIIDKIHVRSSSGHTEERFVVAMTLTLVGKEITARVTLTNRDEMGFRMLVGREALRQGFIVDPAASYLGGKPGHALRKKNRIVT